MTTHEQELFSAHIMTVLFVFVVVLLVVGWWVWR
jgi:hypothetical protein